MKSIPIKLSFAEEVKTFALDLSRPISLEVYADDCEDLEKDIAQFKI